MDYTNDFILANYTDIDTLYLNGTLLSQMYNGTWVIPF